MKRVREPIVAGAFYPGTASSLSAALGRLLPEEIRAAKAPLAGPIGLVVPHAGYVYSGGVAATGFSELARRGRPEWVLILGANHTGLGRPISLARVGSWRTPLGAAPIATDVADRLAGGAIDVADAAFLREHSVEVELPFLQHLFGPEIPFVPLAVMLQPLDGLIAAGERIADVVRGQGVAVVASSDFTHYEPQDVVEEIDRRAIERILALDVDGFYESLVRENLSICGGAAIVVVMVVARRLGWGEARLLAYGTSGDATGDRRAVVGYASILLAEE
jgi:hypothetical protein